jgi:ABC-type phosphate transport system substrate-binding protein
MTAAVCLVSSFAFAGIGYADQPPTGVACAAQGAATTEGKVSGRGASFLKRAMDGFIDGYRVDVCGSVASDPGSGVNMLVYNGSNTTGATGSGQGIETSICRKDAFAGSDIPYDAGSFAAMNGTPGTGLNCAVPAYSPFYQPNSPATWPDPADLQANVMSFPVAGASNAIAINLAAGTCPSRPTNGPINLTHEAASKLLGGDILTWGDPRLVATNATLNGCTVPVTRVVRRDKSGTTQITKTYLSKADGNRQLGSAATCAPPANPATRANPDWAFLAIDDNNVDWPGAPGNHPGGGVADTSQPAPATATCSAVTNGASSGNASMITATLATNGAFSYPDLADALQNTTLVRAGIDNAAPGPNSFQSPGSTAANCDFPTTLPGSNTSGNVGLDPTDTWAIDNPGIVHSDVAFQGSKYPICGLSFVLVYTGLSGSGARPNPIARMTQNQRRTVHSFLTYVLSPAAQNRLGVAASGSGATLQPGVPGYAKLPNAWLTPLRVGFRTNF